MMSLFGLGNAMATAIPDGAFQTHRFLREIGRFRVRVGFLVPTMLQRAVSEVQANPVYDLSSLRMLIYGSSPATPKLIRDVKATFKVALLQTYAMTEAIYEPELNRVYAAMLAHYGMVADPARIRDPNRKGTVESAIQHTQATALKGRRFESIEAQNAYLAHREENWAAKRIHGRAKRQVEEMFQEERRHLRPLPVEGFRYFTEGSRTVLDGTTVQVDGAWYAARPAPIGSVVLVRLYAHEIEIRDLKTLALIRRHCRASHKGEVNLPDAERVFNPSRQTRQILARADAIGVKTQELCRQLFDRRGREGQKSMWGIVGLASRYPAWLLEQACATALTRHTESYQAVRGIADQLFAQVMTRLDGRQAELPLDSPTPLLTQEHELIRDVTEYAAFFKRSAGIAEQHTAAPQADQP